MIETRNLLLQDGREITAINQLWHDAVADDLGGEAVAFVEVATHESPTLA